MARIAIAIEDVNRRGGQERVICELLWCLCDRHDIDLICYQAEDIPQTKVRVLHIKDVIPFSLFLRALWFVAPASRLARRGRYDAVLGQGTNLWAPDYVLAHTCQAHRVHTRRERAWRDRPPGVLERVQWAIRDRLSLALERRMVHRSRGRIMAVGDVLKAQLIRYHDLGEDDVAVTQNGVSHAQFRPGLRDQWREPMRQTLGLSEAEFVVLFVGGRWEDKGVGLLLEALSLMQDNESKLVIVGRGDRDAFGKRAEELGVRERVVFAGETEHPERSYAMADCFAFLSQTEGFGLVQLEAAACGLPLVAVKGQTPPGLVEDGVSGFLVPPEPEAVASRLDAFASDRERCRRAGEASYTNSLNFTWERQAEQIEAFILKT